MDQGMNSSSMPNMSPPTVPQNSMDMAMHMSFYWSKNVVVLFSRWPGSTLGMYILSLFFVFLLAILVEVLTVASTTSVKITGAVNNPQLRALAPAVVHSLRMALAYMIMLAVMSFNLGIFIAAVFGHGVGLFVVKARGGGDDSSPDSNPKV